MTGTDMLREFMGLISTVLSALLIGKFKYLFIGIGASIGVYLINLLMRWFNHA
jgi:hypothetical protein